MSEAADTPDQRQLALQAEAVDTRNWLDQHVAAPPHVASSFRLAHRQVGGLVMTRSAIPFSHFNMVLTLGCPATVEPGAWDEIEQFYGGGEHWVVINDHSEPADLATLLAAGGYVLTDTWDRVILRGPKPEQWAAQAAGAELVTAANGGEWSEFICRCYGMPETIADWLLALVDRPGWIHATRREGDRADGAVVMARSAYVDDGWAWLGIDAPVPGVMAPCFDDDRVVSAALLIEAAARGAHSFVSDIEAPSADRHGPGYDCWHQLGLEPAYLRTVWHKEQVPG